MNMTRKSFTCITRAVVFLALPPFFAGTTRAGQDLAALERVAKAGGEEYIRLRNALLKTHPEPWDVANAAAHSWDTGIAAFILNERQKAADMFVKWDALRLRVYADGTSYALHQGTSDAAAAFLLEKIWKSPSERERDRAYRQFCRGHKEEFAHAGDPALWTATWEQCEDEQIRYAVLYQVCASCDPSTQPIIVGLLAEEGDSLPVRRLRAQCMSGLWHRDTEQTVDAVLGVWDVLSKTGHWKYSGAGVLANNSSERARRFVHDLVLDSTEDEDLRAEIVIKCCLRPHPGDLEVFRRFFTGPGSDKMKKDALRGLYRYPLSGIRPLLRELLVESTDPVMIAAAALTFTQAHRWAKDVPEATKAEDIALFEEVLRTKEGLSGATRVHIDMYIQELRAKPGDPRPTLPDPPQDR